MRVGKVGWIHTAVMREKKEDTAIMLIAELILMNVDVDIVNTESKERVF